MGMIKKLFIIFFISLFVFPICFSQKIPFIDLEKFEQTAQILEEEFRSIKGVDNPNDVMIVVEGNELNGVELVLFDYIKKKYPAFEKLKFLSDKDADLDMIMSTDKTVVLLGGPSQNEITGSVKDGILSERDHPSKDMFSIYEGKNNVDSKILVLSDRRGFENVMRAGPGRSPLSEYMSPNAVVATASFLSVLFAALWTRISGPVRIVLAKYVTGWRKKKIEVKNEARGFSIGKFKLKYREIIGNHLRINSLCNWCHTRSYRAWYSSS